jgi:hypothetical protein
MIPDAPASGKFQPLTSFTAEARAGLRGVLFDIDDTLTSEGRLTAEAYGAMTRLHDAGLLLAPITGRPAGWCDHIARMWPVDAVVGENGAFYFRYDTENRKFIKRFMATDAERVENRRRLDELRVEILAAVPGAAVASDQLYREADLAIDFREDVAPLSPDAIERIVGIFEAAGAVAKVSSIHVNGWFGDYDKLTTTKIMLQECFGIDFEADKDQFVFAGDSPNDAPMFAAFPHAVGVANLRDFEGRLPAAPSYVTEARSGAGFTELADAILAAR